jgi:hypothetical protein
MRSPDGEAKGTWRGAARSYGALVPLVLLCLSAGIAATFGPRFRMERFSSDYAYLVRMDLHRVEELTSQRDALRRQALPAPGFAAIEEPALPEEADDPAADLAAAPLASSRLSAASTPPAPTQADLSEAASRLGYMPLSFDLGGSAEASDSLQVNKPVEFEQRVLGNVAVRIDVGSRIYVSRADLGRILPDGMSAPASADNYVLLTRLRQSGLDLRYDPIRDRFVLRN